MARSRILTAALLLSLASSIGAQQPASSPQVETTLPRFRAGTNLVRIDAYVSLNGAAVTDLTAADFEVFEDDAPQKVETFDLVEARGAAETTTAAATPTSTEQQRAAAQDPGARIFVLYLDRWHVGMDGSARSAEPVQAFLEKVVGPNDLVGIMTPDISPQNISLVRKGAGIDRVLRDVWYWGERDRSVLSDPREEQIRSCYPDSGSTAGIAKEMIERRREQQTLRSLQSTIGYLDLLRDERKFVLLLSEGWVQFRRNDQLGRPLGNQVPGGPESVGVGSSGRLSTATRESDEAGLNVDQCDRDRLMLAYIDHELEVRQLAQRANRANVSFYPLDPRGLATFDDSIGGAFRPAGMAQDRERLGNRHDGLKVLAEQTDGAWVLNTNDTAGAVTRLLADTSSYYLLSYYSTNAKLDGRFRRVTVKVNRPDVEVRARPGYLAPTESEARAAGATTSGGTGGNGRGPVAPSVTRALDNITPARGTLPVRIQASGLANRIRAIIELDPATFKQPEWQTGATLQISVELDRGGSPRVMTVAVPPGQRTLVVDAPDEGELTPGRYYVRVEGRSERGGNLRAATDVTVGAAGASIAQTPIAFRRGPTTGLAYQPTADPRFRRTERIRLQVPILAPGALTGTGRVLTREGQALPLQVVVTEAADEAGGGRHLVADVTLAPLAQGDYVLEVQAGRESATYGFRIVP